MANLGSGFDELPKSVARPGCTSTAVRARISQLEKVRLMDFMNLLQWPAMAVTVVAAWYVASTHKGKRNWGFWLFLISNALWIAWGLYSNAPALVTLQVCLAALNIRGAMKAES